MSATTVRTGIRRFFARKGMRRRSGQSAFSRPEVPRWLAALHRLVAMIILATLCLAAIIVGTALVIAICSCFDRITFLTQRLGGGFAGF